jgi:hypothetical protein
VGGTYCEARFLSGPPRRALVLVRLIRETSANTVNFSSVWELSADLRRLSGFRHVSSNKREALTIDHRASVGVSRLWGHGGGVGTRGASVHSENAAPQDLQKLVHHKPTSTPTGRCRRVKSCEVVYRHENVCRAAALDVRDRR